MSGSGLRHTPSVALLLVAPVSGGQREMGNGKRGGVFMNEGKPGGKNEMPRNAKTRTRRIRFCPPEHINMLSGRTRTCHPGGQERVIREDRGESPGRTRASHPGEQGRVVREDGKRCKDRGDKAYGCFLIFGFRETGGQTCLLY